MAKTVTLVVTGHKETDRALQSLEPKLQKKLVRSALRKSMKRVLNEFQEIVESEAYYTGAYRDSTKILAMKRSRNKVGIGLHVDRDKFFQRYQAEYGHTPHPAAGQTDPFYVPAAIEFGTPTQEPKRPQRRALYDNEPQTKIDFMHDLRELIAEAKTKLAT